MPLPVASTEPLDIPGTAFNSDGLAVLAVSGDRYGGDWHINFIGPDGVKLGSLITSIDEHRKQALLSDPGYPDRAIETAFIWLLGQVREHGWRLAG